MKIKLVVTDANVFIDLYQLGLIKSFFELDIEVHTTTAVFYELYPTQQQILKAFQTINKLTTHILLENDFLAIKRLGYPRSLSEADKSVLYVAEKINACVLSSDKTVRNYAKQMNMDFHGMIWVFDQLVAKEIITKRSAVIKLKQLVKKNFIYQNNQQLMQEVEKRLRIWEHQ